MGFFDSVGKTLASIDPGKTIGNAGVSVDKAVNQIPGGWKTVGALTAAVAAPYLAPELMATEGGGFGINAAGTGNTFGSISAPSAGYTFGGLNASQVPTLASGLELGGATAAGLTGAQKALLLRSGINALGQMTGGNKTGGYGYTGGGNNMAAYQRQGPFLSTAQQNTVPDSTVELLTKLLRG